MKQKHTTKSGGFTLVEIMIVVLIIGILLAIAIPNFVQARESSRAKACVRPTFKQIDSAKQQYMMDKNVSTFASVTQSGTTDTLGGLVGTYVRATPICPAGGSYTTGSESASPSCGLAGSNATMYGQSGSYPHYLP